MCKRNSPQENKASVGCVRETPQIEKKRKEANTGCLRETNRVKMRPAQEV